MGQFLSLQFLISTRHLEFSYLIGDQFMVIFSVLLSSLENLFEIQSGKSCICN